ncbi:hypothetical protein [uncultured Gammaproteobacteria bacterium]|nr:hypothetical protein [uncultured Gammaproteobacteria bacterium]
MGERTIFVDEFQVAASKDGDTLIRYFLVISIPAETPVFSFIDHVI